MLNETGQSWIDAPFTLPTQNVPSANFISHLAGKYALTRAEAIIVLAYIVSLVVGPSCLVLTPWAEKLPLSLGLLIADDGCSNFARAVKQLFSVVAGIMSRLFGRSSLLDISKIVEANGRFALKLLKTRDGRYNDEDAQKRALALQRHHQSTFFPLGPEITPNIVDQLIREAEFATFANLGDAASFRRFLKLRGQNRVDVDRFVNAGWDGSFVPGVKQHPVYPTVTLAVVCDPTDVDDFYSACLRNRLPHLLVATPASQSSEIHTDTTILEAWQSIVWNILLLQRFGTFARHLKESCATRLRFDAEACEFLKEIESWHVRYAQPGTEAAAILRLGGKQVAKIAALLHLLLFASSDVIPLISRPTVEAASECFRWLVKCSIARLRAPQKDRVPSTLDELTVLLRKLRKKGDWQTRRSIVRSYNDQDTMRVSRLLDLGVEKGLIEKDGSRFRAVCVPEPEHESAASQPPPPPGEAVAADEDEPPPLDIDEIISRRQSCDAYV